MDETKSSDWSVIDACCLRGRLSANMEMKNFYFDSIKIKDSKTNIYDIFRIFLGGILKLESLAIVDSIC